MASHFSTIGFPLRSEEEYIALAQMADKKSKKRISIKPGAFYRVWTCDSGAELWLLFKSRSFDTMIPHFSGKSRLKVGITRRGSEEETFFAWGNPKDDHFEETGEFQLLFDCPDFALYPELPLPIGREIQLAAFAHEVYIFETIEAFQANQISDPPFKSGRMASKSFFPIGIWEKPEEATAIFAGHIVNTAVRTNSLSGNRFHWAEVSTLGGTIDVVIDSALVTSPLVIGGVVLGNFWLSGRFLNP